MQEKFLKEVVEEAAGSVAITIVDLLLNKKDVNEFNIAKKLDLSINQTRNLLYRLSHLGILSSTRKKDKRKGWYIYFWTLNIGRSLELLGEKLNLEIKHLEEQLNSKKLKRFYICPSCKVEVSEDTALTTNFMCQECGELYELMDTSLATEELSKKILKLKKDNQLLGEEISKERDKQNKILSRKIKREKAKKSAIRKKKKLAKNTSKKAETKKSKIKREAKKSKKNKKKKK